jgi:protein-tyrosine-phosphatase
VQEAIKMHDLEAMPLDTKLAVKAAKQRLYDEFAGKVGAESVDAVLQASWDHIDAGARIKNHVPLLAERFARGQLWALAHMGGDDGVPAVLFLDTHDGGRAKMAKGLLLQQVGDAVHAFSAGTDPEVDVVPAVLDAMHEVGVSLEQSFPKPYTDEMLAAADLVVTFGDGESVAASNGTPHEHWDVADPRGLSLDEVRAIRADIAARITDLVSRLPAMARH